MYYKQVYSQSWGTTSTPDVFSSEQGVGSKVEDVGEVGCEVFFVEEQQWELYHIALDLGYGCTGLVHI